MITFLKILSVIFNFIPQVLLDVWAKLGGWVLCYGIKFRKGIVKDNLEIAFGKEKKEAELNQIMVSNYEHYVFAFFEVIRSIIWSKKNYLANTKVTGLENIIPFLKEKRGGVFLGAHMGNWEFAVATVAVNGIPIDVVVKESKNATGQKFLRWYRDRFGIGVFLETKTVKDIFNSINAGRFVVFILDQYMGPPIGVPVTFFGREAGTAAGLALFCEKRDIPVFPAYNYRDADGKLCTVIEPRLEYGELPQTRDSRIYHRTQIYNNAIESMIRKHPEQWLWLHRRWKEFKGQSRWAAQTASRALVVLFAGVILSCASKETSPTGIMIPPDPTIESPVVLEATTFSYDRDGRVEPSKEESKSKATSKTNKKSVKGKSDSKLNQESIQPTPTFQIIPPDQIPFEVGERIEIDLRWLALPAGKAVLEVREGPIMNGRPTFQLWGNVLSSKLVDAIYHIDNTAESYIDKELLIPYKFLLHMLESKQNKETRVAFDHVNAKAYYWAKRISERWGNLDVDRIDVLTSKAKDLWSAIYYARYLNYKLNEKQRFVVYENGQNWEVELLPVANELVTSRVGAFQCWKILVHVSLNNVLKPMGDVYMWLSDDSKKHLVKFDAKIKIGSLYGLLTSIRER